MFLPESWKSVEHCHLANGRLRRADIILVLFWDHGDLILGSSGGHFEIIWGLDFGNWWSRNTHQIFKFNAPYKWPAPIWIIISRGRKHQNWFKTARKITKKFMFSREIEHFRFSLFFLIFYFYTYRELVSSSARF